MTRWLDRLFERVYRRLGRRHLAVLRAIYVGDVALTYTTMLLLYLVFYTDASLAEQVRSLFVANALLAIVVVAYQLPRFRRTHEPMERWLAGDHDRAQVLEAWTQSKRFSFDDMVTGVSSGVAVVPYAVYLAWEFDLRLIELATVLIWLAIIVTFISATLVPFAELYVRPLRLELARGVTGTDATPRLSFGNRLLASLVAVSLTTGTAVAFVVDPGDLERLGQLTVFAILITLTTSGVLALLLQRSVMAPMEDLLEVTERVRTGHAEARAPVTTDDEVGRLAAGVNSMLETLERSAAEVRASRERILAASDAERRRVERNIHDGAQQQLVVLAMRLQALRQRLADRPEEAAELDDALRALDAALDELRELAHGLHPTVLTTDGLAAALQQLADRAPVPVALSTSPDRYPVIVESTAWFVASEALANVAKYAEASRVTVETVRLDGHLVVEVVDNGVGGAHFDGGSGLRGLADRVEAVGGSLVVDSPPGGGTTVQARLPLA